MPDHHFGCVRASGCSRKSPKAWIDLTDRKNWDGYRLRARRGAATARRRSRGLLMDAILTTAGPLPKFRPWGRVLYYNINDRRSECTSIMIFLIIFDVLEHISDTETFLKRWGFHLKRGGYAFVNVPAMHPLFKFDQVLGMFGRSDMRLLSQHLADAGSMFRSVRYWALTMILSSTCEVVVTRSPTRTKY